MTDEEAIEIRANIAALWEAVRQLNQNDRNLLTNVERLSNRLLLQEAWSAVEDMNQPRKGSH